MFYWRPTDDPYVVPVGTGIYYYIILLLMYEHIIIVHNILYEPSIENGSVLMMRTIVDTNNNAHRDVMLCLVS